MEYSERDLPVTIKENEFLKLDDGTTVRFEESGGASDVMINDEFTARATLFEGNEYMLEASGQNFRVIGGADCIKVEKG